MDHSVLCHREVVARLRQLAAEKKIPAQDDLLKVGGTDAGVIHVSRGGVRTGGVSIPCRYTHSQTELHRPGGFGSLREAGAGIL